jgi:DNA-binding LytR/AlgR family response regulator
MINAIAIDDEPPALQLLEFYCKNVGTVSLNKTFTDGTEALKYLKKYPVDLIFLDIQMPLILGVDLRKMIDKDKMVIFTTAHSQYALDGFELDAIDFLLKPYAFDRFERAIEKAKLHYSNLLQNTTVESAHIMLRADYSLIKIQLSKIVYIEGLEDYCKIYFDSEAPLIFRITMKALIERLPAHQFVRIHRSYIVSADKVARLRMNTLYIGDKEISIGRLYKNDALEMLKKKFQD